MSTASPDLTWRRRLGPARGLDLDATRLRRAAPLAGLLGLTALLYLWALSRNGWANQYYAAAVQAGSHSWKSFLFGSLDTANYITVDKPPASLWVMELSTRVFGFSSAAMLVPQALEGVAAVAVLYATVRRWFGRPAGLLAGAVLALTPVAALMFRFNNPDALLLLLLVIAAYAVTRALEHGSVRWLALGGAALGFGFLTKELEAFLVLPAFATAYLVAAPGRLPWRVRQLAVAGGTLLLSAGWWVALVELWPAASRPYIGGSTDNSVLQLVFGYNGLDRISSAGGGGPGGAGGFSGPAGIFRLFNSILGGQISWLLPAAGIALVAGIVWTARRPRRDRGRVALVLWGGWLVVTAAVFSFMSGVIHPYYTNLLAPPLAVLLGVGAVVLWQRREALVARLLLVAMLAVTAGWSFVLLERSPSWHPWLRIVVLAGALVAAGAILGGRRIRRPAHRAVASLALMVALAGPTAYTLSTVASAETGSNPSAGPASAATFNPGAGFRGAPGTRSGGAPGQESTSSTLASMLKGGSGGYTWVAATSSSQTAASLELATGKAVMAIGGFSGGDPAITLAHFESLVAQGKIHYYVAGGGPGGVGGGPGGGLGGPSAVSGGLAGLGGTGGPGGGPPGGPGGFAGGGGRFGGAATGGPPAGGGFPARGGGGPGGGQNSVAGQIQSWVESHFKSSTTGGITVYDLTQKANR